VLALLLVLWRATGQRAVQPPRPGDSLVASPGRPAGSPPAAGGLRTVLDERFGGGASGWPDNPQSTAWLADGVYRLVARQPGQFVAVGAPGGQRFRDVVVTAAFRKVAGPPGGGYGIIVRDQGPGPRDGVHQGGRYYVLEAGDRGEFGIWRREGDRWVDLIPWTRSDAIAQGTAPNTLVVQAVGPQLTFIANGVRLASYTDTALAGGAVGIFVGGDLNEAVLERFTIQAPG
jgi:hypothetical protein